MKDGADEAMRKIGRAMDKRYRLGEPIKCMCGRRFMTWEGFTSHRLSEAGAHRKLS